ncbi:MAG: hypothetical protein OHM56_09075 [Spiroplasma phoeniceum]|nr:MAG: hypothetical protein OHM57_08470 [Spiroplasma phoeniceum]UZQ31745.1 MAG: hypothetical protein OHM56_09075 [Spiroplasma phoeniceum]
MFHNKIINKKEHNQNYNPVTSGQFGQNISQQQYSPTRNIGS